MEIYFVTGNKNKFSEASKIIPQLKQLEINLPEIQEIDAHKIIIEKLKEAMKNNEGKIIIEDTSLYMDCLKGLPGPLIKWFLETIGNEGLYEIAEKLNNFNSTAKTVIGYFDGKQVKFFEGNVRGKIAKPLGNGFGWDNIFIPQGYNNRFSEMSPDEKNKISMRGIAFAQLKEYIDYKHQ